MSSLYESDFHAWTRQQAHALRALQQEGTVLRNDLDLARLAEEVENMGARERRELVNRLRVLLTHLLKWQHQPVRRGRSWELTVIEQRERLAIHLRQNPSLRALLPDVQDDAYRLAVLRAERETGLNGFPDRCPYALDDILADGWLPGDPSSTNDPSGNAAT